MLTVARDGRHRDLASVSTEFMVAFHRYFSFPGPLGRSLRREGLGWVFPGSGPLAFSQNWEATAHIDLQESQGSFNSGPHGCGPSGTLVLCGASF